LLSECISNSLKISETKNYNNFSKSRLDVSRMLYSNFFSCDGLGSVVTHRSYVDFVGFYSVIINSINLSIQKQQTEKLVPMPIYTVKKFSKMY
jgi:hypothetical protein